MVLEKEKLGLLVDFKQKLSISRSQAARLEFKAEKREYLSLRPLDFNQTLKVEPVVIPSADIMEFIEEGSDDDEELFQVENNVFWYGEFTLVVKCGSVQDITGNPSCSNKKGYVGIAFDQEDRLVCIAWAHKPYLALQKVQDFLGYGVDLRVCTGRYHVRNFEVKPMGSISGTWKGKFSVNSVMEQYLSQFKDRSESNISSKIKESLPYEGSIWISFYGLNYHGDKVQELLNETFAGKGSNAFCWYSAEVAIIDHFKVIAAGDDATALILAMSRFVERVSALGADMEL
jgi:hypothetical protein